MYTRFWLFALYENELLTVTVELNHKCLLTVTWTVLLRRVADARAAASDLHNCWGRVCLPARQCASTSCLWHSRASAPWDTPVHQSWHVASEQSWPKSGWLLHLGMMQKRVYTNYQSAMRMSCGSGLLRHGLNFSRACWTMRLMWRCWSEIQAVTQHHRLFSQPPVPHNTTRRFRGKQYTFHHTKEFCISQGSAVTFCSCDGQVHNHGYSSFYSEINQTIRRRTNNILNK